MAVKSRAELLEVLRKSSERVKVVNKAAQERALVRSGGEEPLSPTIDVPTGPGVPLGGQSPGPGSTG